MLEAASVAELMDAEATEATELELDAAMVGTLLVASIEAEDLVAVSKKWNRLDPVAYVLDSTASTADSTFCWSR